MRCRRCDAELAGRCSVGGLCPPCFNLPVGERMTDPRPKPPPQGGPWNGRVPPPALATPRPTAYSPGTREKLLEMAARWERGERIHAPGDARPGDGDTVGKPLALLDPDELNELLGPIQAPGQRRTGRKAVA